MELTVFACVTSLLVVLGHSSGAMPNGLSQDTESTCLSVSWGAEVMQWRQEQVFCLMRDSTRDFTAS